MATYILPKLPGNLISITLPSESPLGLVSIPEFQPQSCIFHGLMVDQSTIYSWDLTLGGVPYVYLFGWGPTTIQATFITFPYLNCTRSYGLKNAVNGALNLNWATRDSPFVTISIDGISVQGILVRTTTRSLDVPGVTEFTLHFLR